jgi:sugar lactone lactonase YvrE
MALGGDALWVGDTLNFRLQRFDPVTGKFLSQFGRLGDAPGELPRLKGLAVDSKGRLWISDGYLDQVALFQTDGTFLMSFGGKGSSRGEFSFPAGIAAHEDGRMAVVDSLNRRVKIFAPVPPEAAGSR